MKRNLFFLLIFTFIGCSTVNIPNYVIDKNPYKKTYYSDFNKVMASTIDVLNDFGWKIEGNSNPSVFEQNKVVENEHQKQVMIFTNSRQTPFFLGTKYARINVYFTKINDNQTDIEIRYLAITSVLFKEFEGYKKDAYVHRLLKYIEEKL